MFVASLGSGIVQGAIVALAALGFTLIYNATGVVNFANGPMLLLGANIGFSLYVSLHWPFALALVAAVVAGCVVGVGVDRLVIAPLRQASLLLQVMGLVALSEVLQSVIQHRFGATPRVLPDFAPTVALVPLVRWSVTDLITLGVTAFVVVALTVFLTRTKLGLVMRATASNPAGVGVIGINPRATAMYAWAGGGALTALAGMLILPQVALVPNIGSTLTFLAFAAVVLGGFGSVPGAVLGGVLIGVVDVLVATFFSSGYEPFVSLGIMVVVLTIRPNGILGASRA